MVASGSRTITVALPQSSQIVTQNVPSRLAAPSSAAAAAGVASDALVTVLLLLYPQLPLPRIVAADIAYAVPLTLLAGLGHASLGSVDWGLLVQLLAGSLPGIWLGARLVTRTPERFIRSALSVLLAWAGTKLLII